MVSVFFPGKYRQTAAYKCQYLMIAFVAAKACDTYLGGHAYDTAFGH